MKTLKLILATCVMAVFANAVNVFADEPSLTGFDKYQKDNNLIREDVAAINLHKERIQRLKNQCKTERTAKNEEARIMTQRELAKRKADLRRSEAYLAADKKDLKRDYRLSFRNYHEEISKDQANLNKYTNKLDKDIANGNGEDISSTANKIAYYQNKLKNDKALLNKEQNRLDSDLAAIDKEINKKSVRPSAAALNSETAYARTNGKMYK